MQERLQKLIAGRGLASRRQAEQWIASGRVLVNGAPARLGDTADPVRDTITVDGAPLAAAPVPVYVMLHKPRGYVTTLRDERGRKTVQDLLHDCPVRVHPVGRLDQYSEGLLLLTNDGALTQRLTHPSHQVDKTYLVWVSGYIAGKEQSLSQPIEIDGRKTSPAAVQLLHKAGTTALFRVTIHEGRNRQIRRMCQAAQLHANRLKRIREGALALGDLPVGAWRYLPAEEAEKLKKV